MKHLAAVDEWLEELEETYGSIPLETLEWAGHLVDDWARRAMHSTPVDTTPR
jgi:hypothetical protein